MINHLVEWWCDLLSVNTPAVLEIAKGVVAAGTLLGAAYVALFLILAAITAAFSK